MLPDYGGGSGSKKIIPYLSFKVTLNQFIGNNEANEKINFKVEEGDNILFDVCNIVSGFQWFAGKGQAPDKVLDVWNMNGDKPSVEPATQPQGKTNAEGVMQYYRRFADIPIYSSKLKTRIFSFDGASTYKTAQSIVAQWLKEKSNQNGMVYMYQFKGVRKETNPRDATRQLLIPEFEFKQELSRPSEFDLLTPNGSNISNSSNNGLDDKIPF